jgi:hypothetical protein
MFGLAMLFWMYISFNIFLFGWLVLYILINIKKVGFRKAVKSKTALSIVVWIFVCGVLPVLLFALESIPRSGNQLFKVFIMKPIPRSVEVLDSFDGSPDFRPDNCLHFKISADDFNLILASKGWKVVSEVPDGAECQPWPSPPQSLGSDVIIYSYIADNNVEVMLTNSQMNEVYYYFVDENMP